MSAGGREGIVNVLGRDGNKSDKGFINTQALLQHYFWREHTKKIIEGGNPLPVQLIKGWQKEGKERDSFLPISEPDAELLKSPCISC